jgi:2'-5' RNA ligase
MPVRLLGLLALSAILLPIASAATSLNIHLKLPQEVEAAAISLNREASTLVPYEDIDLASKEQPHVTLYLASFLDDHIDDVLAAIEEIMTPPPAVFDYELLNLYPSGNYYMWNCSIPVELQQLSDRVVTATAQYHDPNPPHPTGIYDMPPEEQAKKLAMFAAYGSPNVFDAFQPHVTIAWDSYPEYVDQIADALPKDDLVPSQAYQLAVGTVGPHGTVVRGRDYDVWSF